MLRRLKMKVACRHDLPKLGRKVIEGYGISKTENQNVIFLNLNLFQSVTMSNTAKGQYTIGDIVKPQQLFYLILTNFTIFHWVAW